MGHSDYKYASRNRLVKMVMREEVRSRGGGVEEERGERRRVGGEGEGKRRHMRGQWSRLPSSQRSQRRSKEGQNIRKVGNFTT